MATWFSLKLQAVRRVIFFPSTMTASARCAFIPAGGQDPAAVTFSPVIRSVSGEFP